MTDGEVSKFHEATTKSNETGGKYGTGCPDTAENCHAGTKLCGRHEMLVGMTTSKVYCGTELSMSDCEVVYSKDESTFCHVKITHNGHRPSFECTTS